jgi:hypothetical protein
VEGSQGSDMCPESDTSPSSTVSDDPKPLHPVDTSPTSQVDIDPPKSATPTEPEPLYPSWLDYNEAGDLSTDEAGDLSTDATGDLSTDAAGDLITDEGPSFDYVDFDWDHGTGGLLIIPPFFPYPVTHDADTLVWSFK